jgi:hypothetical protein
MHGRTCFLYRYSRRRRVFLFVDILAKQTSFASLTTTSPTNFSRAVSALESASALNETILGFLPTSVSFNIVKHKLAGNNISGGRLVIGDW